MISSWCLSFFSDFNISLYSFSEDLALEFGGLYPDSNRMLLLFVFNSTTTYSNISVWITRSFLSLERNVLFTKTLTPPPILLGLCL